MKFRCLISMLLLCGGCATSGQQTLFGLQWPRWNFPGTLDQQRSSAVLHDPYPDAYAGPTTDGMRPREFQSPLPEPVKNRGLKDSWWQR